jgi:hypothetical protein
MWPESFTGYGAFLEAQQATRNARAGAQLGSPVVGAALPTPESRFAGVRDPLVAGVRLNNLHLSQDILHGSVDPKYDTIALESARFGRVEYPIEDGNFWIEQLPRDGKLTLSFLAENHEVSVGITVPPYGPLNVGDLFRAGKAEVTSVPAGLAETLTH